MREFLRFGDAEVEPQAEAARPAVPGKRTLVATTHFAQPQVADPAAASGGGGDPATTPLGDPAAASGQPTPVGNTPAAPGGTRLDDPASGPGDGGTPTAPVRTKTSVTFTEISAAPLTFDGATYRDLYAQVAARVGKEAGSVERRPSQDVVTDEQQNVVTATINYQLATMLPEWTQKSSQPQADQAKFNAWRQSVSDHEAGHRALYKRDLAAVKTQVIGPKQEDVDAQEAQVEAAAETNQDAYDAAGQPAPLAAPGGIEKVPPSGGGNNGSDGGGGGDQATGPAGAAPDQAQGGGQPGGM